MKSFNLNTIHVFASFNAVAFAIIVFLFFSLGLDGQVYNPGNVNYNITYNTGVSTSGSSLTPGGAVPISSLAPGLADLTWSISTTNNGGGSPAVTMSLSPSQMSNCFFTGNSNSGSPQWNWITSPSYACGGVIGNYSCAPGGSVAGAYFNTEVNMPIAPTPFPFRVQMQIFAGDYVQAVYVQNIPVGITYTVYDSGNTGAVPNVGGRQALMLLRSINQMLRQMKIGSVFFPIQPMEI